MSNVPNPASQYNATTVVRVPPAVGTKWHAHLSALDAQSAVRPSTRQTRESRDDTRKNDDDNNDKIRRKGVVGSSLPRDEIDVPVGLWSTRQGALVVSSSSVGVSPEAAEAVWTIREVPRAPGEYWLLVLQDCRLLSASPEGKGVALVDDDDGTGLQRWIFRQVGDAKYVLRVSGGKADDKVILGVDDAGVVRLYDNENHKSTWALRVVPYCENDDENDDDKAREKTTKETHVPVGVEIAGLSERQVDVILQLVSLPENGHPRWYQNYGYVEFLGDGRGFTTTLYGACSGTGDLYMIFDELSKIKPRSATCDQLLKFKDVLKNKRGDDIKGIEPIKSLIKKLGDDPAWQRAVWKVYVQLYWKFAMDWAAKRGVAANRPGPVLATATARGFMLDTAINHGADYDSFMVIVKRMTNKDSRDEIAWVTAFADAREKLLKSGYDDLDTSRTGHRCRLWKQLLQDGNTDLRTPIKAYKGYWGEYTVA